jgi:two-component system cell cycle sensor histidine kinase/response regulator CckA
LTHSPTILVVQHDATASRAIEESLVRIGFEAVFFASGQKAVDWLDLHAKSGPLLGLIDLHLPGVPDGLTLGHHFGVVYQVPFLYWARSPSDLQDPRVLKSQPYGYLLSNSQDDELLATLTLASESLREREQSRQSRVDALSTETEGIIVTDLSGRITYLNPLAENLTGWHIAEATNQPYQEVLRLVDAQGNHVPHLPFIEGRDRSASVVASLARRSGKTLRVSERTSSLTDGDGSLAGLYISFTLHEETFSKSEVMQPITDETGSGRRLAAIVEAITDPLFAMDESWRVTFVNQQAEEHLGRPRQALIGRNFWDEFPDSVHTKYYHEYDKALTEQQPREFEFYHDIRERWMEVHAYPFTEGLLVFLRDITERHKAQERASKLEKLESLGLLARGFAHDFNNLLTVLLGNVALARYARPGEQGYHESLDAARQATEQARNLVQQLLTFAKGGVPITESVDMNGEVVGEVMSARRRQGHITYQMDVPDETFMVEADHGQMVRLVENLIENAEQALLRGGALRIISRLITTDDPRRRQLSSKLDGRTEYVMIEVHDTGDGIPEMNLDRIFEPYFSTRTDANATGLGLTVCDSIVRSHKGFLTIESRFGSHTTARIFLPSLRQHWQAPEKEKTLIKRHTTNNPPRILILDDEKPIRLLMSISLKRDGYEVVETEEGSETVEVYRQAMAEGKCFDLVIMDLSIPNGMGGAEAIQQVRYADPDVLAVVSSGYSDDPVMANYQQYGFSAVLPKPYEPSSLRQLVHRLVKGDELAI